MAKYYSNATDLITFARSSSATYLDSDGVIKTATTDAPRIDYDADRTLKGLLIEEQRTNLLHNTDNPPTQVANLTAGSHTLSFYGGTSASSISDSITGTAVDVFVYDTKRDSDGGAWRTGSLAQASSWYNETLNTNIRGSRREFPEVAVIVADLNNLTIYDGDDPALPMWMLFERTTVDCWLDGAQTLSSVTALNGIVALGSSYDEPNRGGLRVFNFVADFGEHFAALSQSYTGQYSGGIDQRQTTGRSYSGNGKLILDEVVNDVAMTVLPDAPTDPATGLPVPTIAIASDGGVSVIKDDGTVVDITNSNASYTNADNVAVNEYGAFTISLGAGNSHRFVYVFDDIPPADTVITYNTKTATGLAPVSFYTDTPNFNADFRPVPNTSFLNNETKALLGNVRGTKLGLARFDVDTTSPTSSLHTFATSSYATGWMNGDIKLAALADTTAETLTPTELLSADQIAFTSGWAFYNGASITSTGISDPDGGTAAVEITSTGNAGYFFASGTANLQYYRKIYVKGSGTVKLGSVPEPRTITLSSTWTLIEDTQATSSGTARRLQIQDIDPLDVLQVYAPSVSLADPDRSVNGNGLAVHGSLTKAAVATGADVVGYSGFSSSNYLEQPYNSDLDFGTGDFCVMGWFKTSASGTDYIIQRSPDGTGVGDGFFVWVDGNGNLGFATRSGSSSFITGATDVTTGVWHHFAAVRTNSGVNLAIYLDGNIDATGTVTARTVTGVDQQLYVGVRADKANSFAGSLALLRISATAPTADQIKKIYEDEKLLFQPNAKATLDGTSDAVTALAHDPETDLLHVGTNQSRSVFYGLRRINQTGTPVTTAISAVDGLISEQ